MVEMLVVVQYYLYFVVRTRYKVTFAALYKSVAQSVYQVEGIVVRLFYTVARKQSKPAVKLLLRRLQFLYHVRQYPIAEAVELIVIFEQIFGQIARLEAGVVQKVAVRNGEVPLRQVDGYVAYAQFTEHILCARKALCKCVLVTVEPAVRRARGAVLFDLVFVEIVVVVVYVHKVGQAIVTPAPKYEFLAPVL